MHGPTTRSDSGFDRPHPVRLRLGTCRHNELTLMNQWTRHQRVGAGYVADDVQIGLLWTVTVDFGVTRQNFADRLDIRRLTLGEFTNHIYP